MSPKSADGRSEARIEQVILVDKNDIEVGFSEKLAAHKSGKLHRAFSIMIFNSQGETLIQQRALCKYHCPGMWANTCCGHPRPGEDILAAAHRRLGEEIGIDCILEQKFSYIYKAKLDNGLIEHEYLHVFIGNYDGAINPNPEEVMATEWRPLPNVGDEIEQYPDKFAPWFRLTWKRFLHS